VDEARAAQSLGHHRERQDERDHRAVVAQHVVDVVEPDQVELGEDRQHRQRDPGLAAGDARFLEPALDGEPVVGDDRDDAGQRDQHQAQCRIGISQLDEGEQRHPDGEAGEEGHRCP
jgi:hypothetical protein